MNNKTNYKKMCIQYFVYNYYKWIQVLIFPILFFAGKVFDADTLSFHKKILVFFGFGGLFFILFGLFLFLSYKKTQYFIDEENNKLSYCYDFLSYHKTELNFDGIQNINTKRTFVQKILGIYELHIDSGASENKLEIILFLNKKEFENICQVLAQKLPNSNIFFNNIKKVDLENITIKSSYVDIVKFGFINTPFIALLLAFLVFLSNTQQDIERYFGISVEKIVENIEKSSFTFIIFYVCLFFILFLIYAVVTSVIKLYNHNISIGENNSYVVRYGLFNEYNVKLDLSKIKIAYFKQKIIGRILKHGSLFFEVIGFGQKKGETPLIHPYLLFDDVFDVYNKIFKTTLKKESFVKSVKIRLFIPIFSSFVLYVCLFKVMFILKIITVVSYLLIVWFFVWTRNNNNGFYVQENHMVVMDTLFEKNIYFFQIKDITTVTFSQSFIGKKFKFGRLDIYLHRDSFEKPIKLRRIKKENAIYIIELYRDMYKDK